MNNIFVKIKAILKLIRPYQWSKNVLVFGGLIFSGSLTHFHTLLISFLAFIIFCLISSAVYIINDILDLEKDKLHPLKKDRPLAAGIIKTPFAILLLILFLGISLTGAFLLDFEFALVIIAYFIINFFYSIGLKKIVILDVMMVSAGFLLRALAGCEVINVRPSPWLFLCSLVLALFISFGKRRNEMYILGEDASKHRLNLQEYSMYFLDMMMTICATATIVTYSLYTMASETVIRFRTSNLIYTTPFVMFGVFRYFFLVQQKNSGGDPTRLLVHDYPSIINVVLWIITVAFIIYGNKIIQLAGIAI
jgi:4-hydroxybenzoate polyprenyltransferase